MALKSSAVTKLLRNSGKLFANGRSGFTSEAEKKKIREKAQQKILEMRNIVTDLTQHNEQCIKRREELQKTAENYLKALEESGKSISGKIKSNDYKEAAEKIDKMRSLVNEFAYHNQEGIRRRMMMQDRALEYIKALDDYKVRLQTVDPPKIHDSRGE